MIAWEGDRKYPGIEKTFYRGDGKWEGKGGRAAFGKQLPWEGASYLSVVAAMFRMTGNPKYKMIAAASAIRIMDSSERWVDSTDFYQIRMDGNGAFVHFILDAYLIAPELLPDIPQKVERMLEHVWSNHHGASYVLLHRLADDGIRNGWNPSGGEEDTVSIRLEPSSPIAGDAGIWSICLRFTRRIDEKSRGGYYPLHGRSRRNFNA